MDRDRISEKDWAVIAPFLPTERGRNCRPAHDNRLVFAGMLWILRSGAAWRELPDKFGKWNSIYRRFRRWCDAGVFDDLLQTLVDLGMTEEWRVQMVDSTVVRGHSQAAGAKKGVQIRGLVEAAAASRARSTCEPTVSDAPSAFSSLADRPPTAAIFSP